MDDLIGESYQVTSESCSRAVHGLGLGLTFRDSNHRRDRGLWRGATPALWSAVDAVRRAHARLDPRRVRAGERLGRDEAQAAGPGVAAGRRHLETVRAQPAAEDAALPHVWLHEEGAQQLLVDGAARLLRAAAELSLGLAAKGEIIRVDRAEVAAARVAHHRRHDVPRSGV
eukprot:CAMPEP_0184375648 /NCGR_PEP_ID=MMETSP0007-20130409/715_1 /TAXON_ID=97485 /ORGANISM="Prymnesium parvum, Strain Texoma1" /LENGTH=170 /DNA_ID=CAMNT_0026718859 /DNA_START=436 /DNA_END=948 /DNA_ORIENTATION=-